ncbi:MAG: NYN domain-containing protein [Desulfatibacillaceae bacterium]|nr:NYN domain-containing protein [Desulfatibacillaceae bacterium]
MPKIMIFIDGTWLYSNLNLLSKRFGDDYKLDYGKLPHLLADLVEEKIGRTQTDLVRTCLFASIPENNDPADDHIVRQKQDFFDILREEYHYDVEIFPINYRGRHIRRHERDASDEFIPQEKCVDIALASSMLYYAAIPNAYDIAVAVIGDRDFVPVLQKLRRLGKRVAIASVKGSCATDYEDPRDPLGLKDFDTIWIGDHLDKLELRLEKRMVLCQSPFHEGERQVYTAELIRKGRRFYCAACREKYRKEKPEKRPRTELRTNGSRGMETLGPTRHGVITRLIDDRGFGFIQTDFADYFFHLTDLTGGLRFEELAEGDFVTFEVRAEPEDVGGDKQAGKAANVRPREGSRQTDSDEGQEENDNSRQNPLKNLPELDEQDENLTDDEEAQPGNRRFADDDSGY